MTTLGTTRAVLLPGVPHGCFWACLCSARHGSLRPRSESAFFVSSARVLAQRVVIKPGVNVKYPWHLQIADDCWIGEIAWIDNLTTVQLGSNVCISQGAYLCTGNHDWSDPLFGLLVAPIRLMDSSWAGAKCILTPGVTLGQGAVAGAGSVIVGQVPDYQSTRAIRQSSSNSASFAKLERLMDRPHISLHPRQRRSPSHENSPYQPVLLA